MAFSHKRVQAHLDAARAEVLAELEKRARAVLRNNPSIASFCMSMGRASFHRKDGEPIMDDLKCFKPIQDLLDEYDNEMKLMGIPLKLKGADEPKITDW